MNSSISPLIRTLLISICACMAAALAPMNDAYAHSGDVVLVPKFSSAPIFDDFSQFPGGCNFSKPGGYQAGAQVIHIDSKVTVYLQQTDTDLYIGVVGIDPRGTDPPKLPDPNDRVSVFFDIDHSGSASPTKRDLMFTVSPTGPRTVSGKAVTGPLYTDLLPAVTTGADLNIAGADAGTGEFLVSWNAQLRLNKAIFEGAGTVGLRIVYNVGIPFQTHDVGIWPVGSDGMKPNTWGDMILGTSVQLSPMSGVLTNNNNNARTGSYFDSILNPGNVAPALFFKPSFGKLFTYNVDGQIYAQPLYVHGLTLTDGTVHNAVFAATEKDNVYAFDADAPHTQLWTKSLGNPVPWNANGNNIGNIAPWFGITSTPVIDLGSRTIYIVTYNQVPKRHSHIRFRYLFKLHALDLGTGQEKFNGPVEIVAQAPGTADDSHNGIISFNPIRHLNRPGLLLANRQVYLAFGSHGDNDPYHGWVMSYDATNLKQNGVFITTPTGPRGGVWQSGRGLAADQLGNVFLMTGNGEVSASQHDLGQSFVRLDSNAKLSDSHTVEGDAQLNHWDLDVGSSGPVLIESPTGNIKDNRILGGGKEGYLYLLDANDLNHGDQQHRYLAKVMGTRDTSWLGVPFTLGTILSEAFNIHAGPVLWDKFGDGKMEIAYLLGEHDNLKAFQIGNKNTFDQKNIMGPIHTSAYRAPPGMPGGALSISHSSDPDSAIIWATVPLHDDANGAIVKGNFMAFKASDLSLLWRSEDRPQDSVGLYGKFCPPTIADGKVFVSSFGSPGNNNALLEYGIPAN